MDILDAQKTTMGKHTSEISSTSFLQGRFSCLDDSTLSVEEFEARIILCCYAFDTDRYQDLVTNEGLESEHESAGAQDVEVDQREAEPADGNLDNKSKQGVLPLFLSRYSKAKEQVQIIFMKVKNTVESRRGSEILQSPNDYVNLKPLVYDQIHDKISAYRNENRSGGSISPDDSVRLYSYKEHIESIKSQYGHDYAIEAITKVIPRDDSDRAEQIVSEFGELIHHSSKMDLHLFRLMFQLSKHYNIQLARVLSEQLISKTNAYIENKIIKPGLVMEDNSFLTITAKWNTAWNESFNKVKELIGFMLKCEFSRTDEVAPSIQFVKDVGSEDQRAVFPLSNVNLLAAWEELVESSWFFVEYALATQNLRTELISLFSNLYKRTGVLLIDEQIKRSLLQIAREFADEVQQLSTQIEMHIRENITPFGLDNFHFSDTLPLLDLKACDWTVFDPIRLDLDKQDFQSNEKATLHIDSIIRARVDDFFSKATNMALPRLAILIERKSWLLRQKEQEYGDLFKNAVSQEMNDFLMGKYV